MKFLPTQHLKPSLYAPVEKQLIEIFRKILFDPIAEVIRKYRHGFESVIYNVIGDVLREAIRKGRIQYHDGVFSGQFSAAISRSLRAFGARFLKSDKTYRIDPKLVPSWIRAEASAYQIKAREASAEIKRQIDLVHDTLDQAVQANPINANPVVQNIEDGWKSAAKVLEVNPTLSFLAKEHLAADYTENMKLWIKKFSEKMIKELREEVEQNSTEGYRFDALIDRIRSRYHVSETKAKFLARQETGLFMSKFREQRFKDSGVVRYKWSTSHDERVRPAPGTKGKARLNDHRRLDGRIFYYDDPPVVDLATGRRANPHQDYNCRCVDIPILD